MLTHVVLFRFKNPEDAPEAQRRLLAMEGQIESLKSIEVGLNFIDSTRNSHLVLITKFDDRVGMQLYQEDAMHQTLLAWLKTVIDEARVVDFFGKETF